MPFVKCKFNSIKSATQITINSVKAANFAYFCGRLCRSFLEMKWEEQLPLCLVPPLTVSLCCDWKIQKNAA